MTQKPEQKQTLASMAASSMENADANVNGVAEHAKDALQQASAAFEGEITATALSTGNRSKFADHDLRGIGAWTDKKLGPMTVWN